MGATAAIITSMGLIAGLTQDSAAKKTIIAGLLIIAIADNISDTLSLHIYKESEGAKKRDIAYATRGNFIARLLIVFSFILIVYFMPMTLALIISSVWGVSLLICLSIAIAKVKKSRVFTEILWHVIVAIVVIIICKLLGMLIYDNIM